MRIATTGASHSPQPAARERVEAIRTLLRIVAVACALALAACSRRPADVGVRETFDGHRALELAVFQVGLGPRIPGSQAHASVGTWIAGRLEDNGWKVKVDTHTYDSLELRNIVARGGPEGGPALMLGTHYDTRPVSDRDLANPDAPVPGASDGASGVAVLLELSRVIDPADLAVPIELVFFDGEDSGRVNGLPWALGSTLFAQTANPLPTKVVIVDMVGDSDLQIYLEANSDAALAGEIWQVAAHLGIEAFVPEVKHSLVDDHTPFLRAGVPAVLIIDFDYPFWHTSEDTIDKLSADSLGAVGMTLEAWLRSQARSGDGY